MYQASTKAAFADLQVKRNCALFMKNTLKILTFRFKIVKQIREHNQLAIFVTYVVSTRFHIHVTTSIQEIRTEATGRYVFMRRIGKLRETQAHGPRSFANRYSRSRTRLILHLLQLLYLDCISRLSLSMLITNSTTDYCRLDICVRFVFI